MLKIIALFMLFTPLIYANEQIILVISDDFNTSKARLFTYEKQANGYVRVFESFSVNLGRNGLGWGEGIKKVEHLKNEPLKYEGDGRAPAGIFKLGYAFGYASKNPSKLTYIQATDDLICVDDAQNKFYNQVLHVSDKSKIKSYENMHRNDNLYEIGVMVGHNSDNISKRGSCIFLHIEKGNDSATAGCTSMSIEKLSSLMAWLDAKKAPILIQLPSKYCAKGVEKYKELICPND